MYDQTAKTANPEREATLNERLNREVETLMYQCERIESVLSRVNGTPQKIEGAKNSNAPRPTLSMQNALEALATTTQRLVELTGGIERIA